MMYGAPAESCVTVLYIIIYCVTLVLLRRCCRVYWTAPSAVTNGRNYVNSLTTRSTVYFLLYFIALLIHEWCVSSELLLSSLMAIYFRWHSTGLITYVPIGLYFHSSVPFWRPDEQRQNIWKLVTVVDIAYQLEFSDIWWQQISFTVIL